MLEAASVGGLFHFIHRALKSAIACSRVRAPIAPLMLSSLDKHLACVVHPQCPYRDHNANPD
jgi:hypothetical protein